MNNNNAHWDVTIRLSFAGSALMKADVSISDSKGFVTYITLEHPVLYLDRFLRSLPNYSNKALQNVVESSVENIALAIEEKSVKLLYAPHQNKLDDLLQQIEEGLSEFEPVVCDEGVNGTYFLKNKSGKFVAVFKPEDEEANSANNKKTSPEKEDKLDSLKFLRSGEASKREVAAYIVDKEGFFGVPKTTLVSIAHPKFGGSKVGSLQEFVESDGPSWDVGPSLFPVKEVHKIGILDLYIFNFDRHGGNMLFKEEDGSLIPIDNGFALPDHIAIPNLWFEWLNFPQSKKPFDAETRAFIERLDPDCDIAMLKKELGLRDECLRVMKFSATLLKKAAASGLTLYEIGRLICGADPAVPGVETIFRSALSRFGGRTSLTEEEEKAFQEHCDAELSLLIAKKAKL
jgi:mRNA-degrading endonuclease RelE of RelBE toxin-antitoxin system